MNLLSSIPFKATLNLNSASNNNAYKKELPRGSFFFIFYYF